MFHTYYPQTSNPKLSFIKWKYTNTEKSKFGRVIPILNTSVIEYTFSYYSTMHVHRNIFGSIPYHKMSGKHYF